MILVDSSVWVDHLRAGDRTLVNVLERSGVLGHPWVTGELALGRLSQRIEVLQLLHGLPQAEVATATEVATLIEGHQLYGRMASRKPIRSRPAAGLKRRPCTDTALSLVADTQASITQATGRGHAQTNTGLAFPASRSAR